MKRHLMHNWAVILLLILALPETADSQYSIPAKMNWWYESRFGMFIHFGSYSYLGHGEWAFSVENWTKSNYQSQVSSKFNPTSFNAGVITRMAKKAGMKYLVITAKHHEGFCMWGTGVQSFKDVTGTKMYDLPGFTPFATRDVLQELKDSCDAQDIKFCLYYSILDWNHPSQTILNGFSRMSSDSARTRYIADMKTQLAELIARYHPAVLWFDGDWTAQDAPPTLVNWWTKSDGADLYNYLVGLDSNLIVNERVARGFGLGDFNCPENTVPTAPLNRQWETCRTMNNSWGYNAGDTGYKTAASLIQEMVLTVSRDGNYLLNIGPKGDGTVPGQSAAILNSFGDWMDLYGESIYGTTRSPFKTEPKWGVCTKKSGKLYAHVLTRPSDGQLKLPSLDNPLNKIFMMNDTTILLDYRDSLGCTTVTLPPNAPNTISSVVVLDVTGVPLVSTKYVKTSSIVVRSARATSMILSDRDTLQMTATISPSTAAIKSVTWSLSDSSLASITAGGLLTAKNNGAVIVLATADDGTFIQGRKTITISGQTDIPAVPGNALPSNPALNQNFPNPFNPETTIGFSLAEASIVSLKVYDLLGREMAVLVENEKVSAGDHSAVFQAAKRSSGIYICTLSVTPIDPSAGSRGIEAGRRAGAREYMMTKKMVLLK